MAPWYYWTEIEATDKKVGQKADLCYVLSKVYHFITICVFPLNLNSTNFKMYPQ